MPSTMNRMKLLASENGPVATVEKVDEEVGDVIGQHSAGIRLRNVQQVSNARRHLNMGKVHPGSQLIEAMEMCKSGISSKNPFVRCVQAAPEPMCVLATEQQLSEMTRNCTDPLSYVPIGVDPTFKLGQFYVTPVVFALKMLICKDTGKSPIYLGPLLIHQSMKFTNYHYFASQLVGLCPGLKDTKAVGTDGEGPLYEAFCNVFPNAVHLRCFSHFQRNIEDKMKQLGLPQAVTKEMLRDIMGVTVGTDRYQGLVDATSEKDFREKLCALKERWDTFEQVNRSVPVGKEFQPEFHDWFIREKADVIVNCMLPDARTKAGLGENPDHFYTNMCESMNKTLKCHTDYKEQELHVFIEKMQTFTQVQDNLLRKAVIRSGSWRFRPEYNHLEVHSDKWFTLSEKGTTKSHEESVK